MTHNTRSIITQMSENSGTDHSLAAIILALCLGLASCNFEEHYSKKIDVERQILEQQLKK